MDIGKLLNCESSSHVQFRHIFTSCCPSSQMTRPLVFDSVLIHLHCHACLNLAAFVELKIPLLCQSKTLFKQLLCQINNSTVFGVSVYGKQTHRVLEKMTSKYLLFILYLPGRFPHNGRIQLCRLPCQGIGHVLPVTCSAFSTKAKRASLFYQYVNICGTVLKCVYFSIWKCFYDYKCKLFIHDAILQFWFQIYLLAFN